MQASWGRRDDDIALLAPGVDVAVRLDDLLERIAPIDDRPEGARR
jgi:hypothetical protein